MSTVIGLPVAAAGGRFLLETRTPEEVFTPEDLTEEHRQIAGTAAQFAREEILPATEALEAAALTSVPSACISRSLAVQPPSLYQ